MPDQPFHGNSRRNRPSRIGGKTTTERGYGWKHQKLRAAWKFKVDRGEVACGYCGGVILPGTPWHLGHPADRKDLEPTPWHRSCNLRYANARRARDARAGARLAEFGRPEESQEPGRGVWFLDDVIAQMRAEGRLP